MKRLLLLLLFIFAFSNFSIGQNSLPKNLVGVYRSGSCALRCETIKINGDLTFEFLFEQKDLYKGSLKGDWKVLEGNKINLKARDEKRIKQLKEIYESDGMSIEPFFPTEIDYDFIFRKKKLCLLFNGGAHTCYKKLSRKQSQRSFPPK